MPSNMSILSTAFTKDANSFFYGMEMDNDSSKINAEGRNWITTRTHFDPISGNDGHDGVPNKRGSLGVYTIKVNGNALAGQANFIFSQMEARSNSTNGIMNFPEIEVKICGVNILDNENIKPVLSLSSNWDSDYLVQVSGNKNSRYVLEKSPDLMQWKPVSTNWGSFTWADKGAERDGERRNFYRAREE